MVSCIVDDLWKIQIDSPPSNGIASSNTQRSSSFHNHSTVRLQTTELLSLQLKNQTLFLDSKSTSFTLKITPSTSTELRSSIMGDSSANSASNSSLFRKYQNYFAPAVSIVILLIMWCTYICNLRRKTRLNKSSTPLTTSFTSLTTSTTSNGATLTEQPSRIVVQDSSSIILPTITLSLSQTTANTSDQTTPSITLASKELGKLST